MRQTLYFDHHSFELHGDVDSRGSYSGLPFSDAVDAYAFMQPLAGDHFSLLALRTLLAEDGCSGAMCRLRDHEVLEQVAHRLVSGRFALLDPEASSAKPRESSRSRPGFMPNNTGMPHKHFEVFRRLAADKNMILLVRGAKRSSTRWIERGYPAKPMNVKTKTHPATGIVTVDVAGDDVVKGGANGLYSAWKGTPEENKNTYVVQPVGKGVFRALNQAGEVLKDRTGKPLQYGREALGQVIDGTTGLPYVSDYDLQDVVFPEGSTYTTRSGKKLNLGPGSAALWDVSGRDFSNPWTNEIRREANRRLREVDRMSLLANPSIMLNPIPQDRVLHGPDAAANEPGKDVTVFYPDGSVEWLPTAADLQKWYEERGRKTRTMGPHGT